MLHNDNSSTHYKKAPRLLSLSQMKPPSPLLSQCQGQGQCQGSPDDVCPGDKTIDGFYYLSGDFKGFSKWLGPGFGPNFLQPLLYMILGPLGLAQASP